MNDLISRQAAIDAILHHGDLENDYTDLYHDGYCDGIYDSCDVLKDLPSAQPEFAKDTNVPTNDCISRQSAIDEIKAVYEWHDAVTEDRLIEHMIQLPSAQPERTGKWIETIKHYKDDEQEYDYIEVNCSECGVRRKIGWRDARCCPNCGVKIEGVTVRLEQEGEEE